MHAQCVLHKICKKQWSLICQARLYSALVQNTKITSSMNGLCSVKATFDELRFHVLVGFRIKKIFVVEIRETCVACQDAVVRNLQNNLPLKLRLQEIHVSVSVRISIHVHVHVY